MSSVFFEYKYKKFLTIQEALDYLNKDKDIVFVQMVTQKDNSGYDLIYKENINKRKIEKVRTFDNKIYEEVDNMEHIIVNFFKSSFKWYLEVELIWNDFSKMLVEDKFQSIINEQASNLKGMYAICLENPAGCPLMAIVE